VLDLLQIFGWPAAILLVGVLLDFYSDTELKTIVVEYLRGVRQPKDISVSLHLFLHGFLFRLLGNIANLSRCFLRSSIISIIAVIIIFSYQQYHIKFVKEGCYLSCHTQYFFDNYVNGWAILTLLFANCIVDYCYNIVDRIGNEALQSSTVPGNCRRQLIFKCNNIHNDLSHWDSVVRFGTSNDGFGCQAQCRADWKRVLS
jgi:hypothetical protein